MIRKKYNKKKIALAIFIATSAILILTFYVWHQMESIRIGYEIGKLEEELLVLREDVKKLEIKKSSLLSLEKVEKIAREKLKLFTPKEEQIIYDDFSPVP